MNLVVNTHELTLKEEDNVHISRRMGFAFSHYHSAIETLELKLSRISNAKGSNDTECKLVAYLPGQEDIVIIEQQAHLKQAIDRAMFRASYILKQRFKRNSQRFYKNGWTYQAKAIQPAKTTMANGYESKG